MTIRKFNNDQRLQIAKEVFDGKSRKQVAFEWGISRTCLDEIFYEYIEWRMVWKPTAALSQPLTPTNGASPRILGLEHETSNSKDS